MTRHLLLFSKPDRPEIASWALVDTVSDAVLAKAVGMPEPQTAARTVLILSGVNVGSVRTTLPKRITSQVRQALPMLLEDTLAVDGSDTHIAVGPRLDGERLIAVTSRPFFAELLEKATGAGHDISLAVPDYMLLAPPENQAACLLQSGDHLIVALANGTGGTIEASLAPTALRDLLPPSSRSLACHCDDACLDGLPEFAAATKHPPLSEDDLARRCGRAAENYRGLNLLQGGLGKRRRLKLSWPHWRRTAALAALALVLLGAIPVMQGRLMNERAGMLDTATWQQMRATFPAVRNLSHFRARIRQLEARGEDPFLRLSQLLFTAVNRQDAAAISEIQYDSFRREMVVRLSAPSVAELEAVRNALSATHDIVATERETLPTPDGNIMTLALEVRS